MKKKFTDLLDKLEKGNWEERLEAVNTLSLFSDHKSLDILIKASLDEDEFVREAVAGYLGERKEERVVPALLKLFNDIDKDVSSAAFQSLKKFKSFSPGFIITFLKEDRSLKDKQNLIFLMGEMRLEVFTKYLVPLLEKNNNTLRSHIIQSLIKIGSPEALLSVISYKSELSVNMKLDLLEAMGKLEEPYILKYIKELFLDKSSEVRYSAAFYLGNTGGEEAKELLVKGLEDPDDKVRVCCARALLEIGDIKSLELLINFLENADSELLLFFFNSDLLKRFKIILKKHPDQGTPEDIELLRRIKSKISRYDKDIKMAASKKLSLLMENSPRDIIILYEKENLFPEEKDIELISTN